MLTTLYSAATKTQQNLPKYPLKSWKTTTWRMDMQIHKKKNNQKHNYETTEREKEKRTIRFKWEKKTNVQTFVTRSMRLTRNLEST